jgi:hypothetical protein
VAKSPTNLDAKEAAQALERALGHASVRAELTIADAAAKGGLALRDAERGLFALVDGYRGHIRATSEGELVFVFPDGLTRPWLRRTRFERAGRAVLRWLGAAARFVVRAWISIVLVAYAVGFLALIIGLTFFRASSRSDSNDRGGSFDFGIGPWIVLRILSDALFWTFHPLSPVAVGYGGWGEASASPRWQRAGRRAAPEEPFYERVNRFFFGPARPPVDPREIERRLLAEIRAERGRIGLADVMRVTGLPRDEADPLMARLMLDYDGTVEVGEEGGIVYRFAALRRTVAEPSSPRRPPPVWAVPERLRPLTGNGVGSNVLIAGLNGFNLLASLWVLDNHMTFARIGDLLAGVRPERLPPAGTPIALGVVPLVFSIALFALPAVRALVRPLEARRVARENGRRAVLREILEHRASREGVDDEALARAFKAAAGRDPGPKEITREVVALGGDVDLDVAPGRVRYRFADLEAEAHAVAAEREAAAEEEARVGEVVFTSEDPPPGRAEHD